MNVIILFFAKRTVNCGFLDLKVSDDGGPEPEARSSSSSRASMLLMMQHIHVAIAWKVD